MLIQLTVLGLLTLAAVFLAGAVGGGAGTVALIIMLIMAAGRDRGLPAGDGEPLERADASARPPRACAS